MATLHGTTAVGPAAGTTWTQEHTVNASADFLTVDLVVDQGTDLVTGVTADGDAMTQEANVQIDGGSGWVYRYKKTAPSTGAIDIVVSLSSSQDGGLVIRDWSGVDQTTPLRAAVAETDGPVESFTSSAITSQAGETIVDITGWGGSSDPTVVPNGGQSMDVDGDPSGNKWMAGSTKTSGGATDTVGYSWTGNRRTSVIANSIIDAAAGDIVVLRRRREAA